MAILLNFLAMLAFSVGGGFIGASIKTPREQRKALPLIGMGLLVAGFIFSGIASMMA